ncbi:MAG: hypothetical protein M9958_00515 [Chitinophagales bacterium]|nr:hypothetical protein [Chitinophagales bacterium]
MNKVTILNRQSLLDIALQETGIIEAAFDIAIANGLSVTDYAPGAILMIPNNIVVNEQILKYYKSNKIQPATFMGELIISSNLYVDEDYWDEDYTNEN